MSLREILSSSFETERAVVLLTHLEDPDGLPVGQPCDEGSGGTESPQD